MDGVLGIVENRSVLREQDRVDGGGGCYPDFGGTGSEGEAHQKQKQQRRVFWLVNPATRWLCPDYNRTGF